MPVAGHSQAASVSLIPSTSALHITPAPLSSNINAESASIVSLSGKVYPSLTFPLSLNSDERNRQHAVIAQLESKYSSDRLAKHQFDWIRSSSESQGDEWRPIYFYWKPVEKNASPTVEEIWTEYVYGMNGHLSVRELNAGWNARWRSSGAARTETSRRKKIVTLIETLSAKSNWNDNLALRFLKAQYPIPTHTIPHLKTTRAFIDRLQKADGQLMREILVTADNYISSV